MVRIHAQTMRPATPQRTADSRRVAPTPTIEPVIVCVVLMPMPISVAMRIATAAPVSAAKPPTGASFVIFVPIVRTIRQPPESVPRPMATMGSEHDPERHIERRDVAGRDEHAGDDAHRLLGVIGPVHEAEQRRRQQLQPPEQLIDPGR